MKSLFQFLKFNIVSIIATAIDFSVFLILTEGLSVYYVFSNIISAICGGITAFLLNKNWVFLSRNKIIKKQIYNYAQIWISSIILNTLGIYLLVEKLNFVEFYSKVIVSIIIGILFNFTMNKYYVFKK